MTKNVDSCAASDALGAADTYASLTPINKSQQHAQQHGRSAPSSDASSVKKVSFSSHIDSVICSKQSTSPQPEDQLEATSVAYRYVHHEKYERTMIVRILGKLCVFLTLLSALYVGLHVNLCQFILLGTSRLSNAKQWRRWHKRLIGHCNYVLFSPFIGLLYFWNKFKLNIYLDDLNLIEEAREPMIGLMIPNHSYELDYMACFVMADQLGNMGAYKSMSKDELKYLPVVGWALWMSDIVFVKRNWRKDRLTMAHKLSELFDYDQSLLGLFAEGTRWTPEKQEGSSEYARARGWQPFKHHLCPRTRGFVFTARHYMLETMKNANGRMADKKFRVYNLQICMPKVLRFPDFLNGQSIVADVYCERVQLEQELYDEVRESRDETDCPKLEKKLIELYRRKDELVDEYERNNRKGFVVRSPKGGQHPFAKGWFSLSVWLCGMFYTYASLILFATYTSLSQSATFWTLLIGFVGACFAMLLRIEHESNATKSRVKPLTKSAGDADASQPSKHTNGQTATSCAADSNNNSNSKQ